MKSLNVVRGSAQVRRVADYSDSLGVDAVFLAEGYGLVADDWQARIVEDWLAVDDGERLLHSQCGLAVPRQNGKNAILEIVSLYKAAVQGRRLLHSSHEVKTTRKAFIRLKAFFESAAYPELGALVQSIRSTNGQEAIVLSNGGSIEFIARTKNSGRGFTVDDLILDEAQDLDEDALSALLPTISAAPSGDAQIIMTGTPPIDLADGVPFQRLRENLSARACWIEYGIGRDEQVGDRDTWFRVNPALGDRLSVEAVETEFEQFSVEAFARERLGRWPTVSSAALFDMDSWDANKGSAGEGRKFMALDMSFDRSRIFVGVAVSGDKPFVEVALDDDASVVSRGLVEMLANAGAEKVFIDGHSPAVSLLDRLVAAGVPVEVTGMGIMSQACGQFQDAVRDGNIAHSGQAGLRSALQSAKPRPIGSAGGFGYHRRGGGDYVAALVAVTLAHYGAVSAGFEPVRKIRMRLL